MNRYRFFIKYFFHQIIAQGKGHNEHKAVVVNPKASNFKKSFTWRPVKFQKVHMVFCLARKGN